MYKIYIYIYMWPRLTMRCPKRTSSSLTKVAERIVAIGIVTTNQTEMRSCIGMNNNSHIYIYSICKNALLFRVGHWLWLIVIQPSKQLSMPMPWFGAEGFVSLWDHNLWLSDCHDWAQPAVPKGLTGAKASPAYLAAWWRLDLWWGQFSPTKTWGSHVCWVGTRP